MKKIPGLMGLGLAGHDIQVMIVIFTGPGSKNENTAAFCL